jgi:WD40 repeat protein
MLLRPLLCAGVLVLVLPALPAPAQAQPDPKRLDADGRPLPAGALARLGTTKLRLRQPVHFLGFAGERTKLLAVSDQGQVRLWDLPTGKDVWAQTLKRDERDEDKYGPYAGSIREIALSADGKVAAWWAGTQVKVIDTATGKEVASLSRAKLAEDAKAEDFNFQQARIQLSPDGQYLTLQQNRDYEGPRSRFNKVAVWRTSTGALVRVIELDKSKSVAASVLGADNLLVTLERPGREKDLFDKDGEDKKEDKKEDKQDDARKRLRFWNLATGQQVWAVAPEVEGIADLQLLPGGKALVGFLRDDKEGGAILLDAGTGKTLRVFGANEGMLTRVQASADGKRLLGSGTNGVWLWDTGTGKELLKVPASSWDRDDGYRGGRDSRVRAALAPDGKTVAVATGVGFRLWDADTGKEVTAAGGHFDGIASIAFAPAGDQVLTAAAYGPLLLSDAQTGRLVREFPFAAEPLLSDKFRGIGNSPWKTMLVHGAFAPDGKTVAGLKLAHSLQRWDAATGTPLKWETPAKQLTAFAFAPNGKHVLLAGADGGVRLVRADTGKEVRRLIAAAPPEDGEKSSPPSEKLVTTVFAPDGRLLFIASLGLGQGGPYPGELGTTLQGFETVTGQQRFRTDAKFSMFQPRPEQMLEMYTSLFDVMVFGLTAAPDGKYLAAATPVSIKLWDLTTGKEVRLFGGRGLSAPTATFSPDGKWLLAGKEDGSLRVWDVATGTALADVPLHDGLITALAFSPDGKVLASGAADTTVLLWDWAALRGRVTAAAPGKATDLLVLWQVLADGDGAQVRDAVAALARTPGPTVAFLKERVKAAPAVDGQRLAKLLADLDSKQFAVRQQATKELEQLGDIAAAVLEKRLAGKVTLEEQRRLEALRDKLDGPPPVAVLRALRAVEVLEHIGTPEARQVLEALAAGAAGHRLTEESAASVRRLAKRS